MIPEKSRHLRSVTWSILAIIAGIAAWAAGIITDFALVNGCMWAERNAPLVYLTVAALVASAFYFLHRMPFLDRDSASSRTRVFALMLVAPWLFGLLITGPNQLGAINRGRQKRTMADMRKIGVVLHQYRDAHGEFPATQDLDELSALLLEFQPVPDRDAWGHPWVVEVSSSAYTLISLGKCGEPDFASPAQYEFGNTTGLQSDIVYSNGKFVRSPEGVQAN